MRIATLLKLLIMFLALNVLLGGRAFYSLLFTENPLFNHAQRTDPLADAGWLASYQAQAEFAFYAFCALVAITLVFFYLCQKTLLSLNNLHRIIDQYIDVQRCELVRPRHEQGDLQVVDLNLDKVVKKLQDYGQYCLDASPLTRLPGNIAIERALMEKMRAGSKFSLCYADLDNFKFFNDRYGFSIGSEVLKMTGAIVREAQIAVGNADDFVGHIGGDDFVIITSPERAAGICEFIIRNFDRSIRAHYPEEDLRRGILTGKDRFGVVRTFPLMTISIAVVTDLYRDIKSPTEIARIAAEIKDYVKQLPGSNYLTDRRRRPFAS